nr:MAG TPA: hypothetical protein [Caudoviricetes sp.]
MAIRNIIRMYVEKLCRIVILDCSWYKQWYIACIESVCKRGRNCNGHSGYFQ